MLENKLLLLLLFFDIEDCYIEELSNLKLRNTKMKVNIQLWFISIFIINAYAPSPPSPTTPVFAGQILCDGN